MRNTSEQKNADAFRALLGDKQNVTDAELGRLLRFYVAEADHGNWEGFSSRDRTGIERLLGDMYLNFAAGDYRSSLTVDDEILRDELVAHYTRLCADGKADEDEALTISEVLRGAVNVGKLRANLADYPQLAAGWL